MADLSLLEIIITCMKAGVAIAVVTVTFILTLLIPYVTFRILLRAHFLKRKWGSKQPIRESIKMFFKDIQNG